jgi:phage repressor protein C with HTH and peptisase S24 domain
MVLNINNEMRSTANSRGYILSKMQQEMSMGDFDTKTPGELAELTFGERVKFLRTEKSWSQTDLAERAGISQNAVAKIEQGGNTSNVVELAKALDVSPAFLKLGEGMRASYAASLRPIAIWENEDDLPQDKYIFIPALEIKLSAGNGNLVWHVDERGQRQAFTQKWADRMGIDAACAATMVVSGSSMEPRYQDGDSVVVDYCQRDTIIDGKVYAIILNNETYIKRLFKEVDGSVRIVSDNPDKSRHPDRVVMEEYMDKLAIIGRVVALAGAAI